MIMAREDTVIRKVMHVEGKRVGGEKKAGTLERRKNGKECLPLKEKQSKAF